MLQAFHIPMAVLAGVRAKEPHIRSFQGLWRWGICPIALTPMSKKTKKRKARMRRSKANHGKRPNMGRG